MALMLSGYLAHVCTERLAWPMLYNLMLYLPSQILYSYGSGSDSPNNNNNNNIEIMLNIYVKNYSNIAKPS